MDAYEIKYREGWDEYFEKLDATVQARIYKKIQQLKTGIASRHLQHGLPYFVEEVGGYRIAYKTDEATKTRQVCFSGSHKDYEKWFKSQ